MAPPALQMPLNGPLTCAHNIIKAHAEVYQLFSNNFKNQNQRLGIALDATWAEPALWTEQDDIEAAWRFMHFDFGWFGHPILKNGDYSDIMKTTIEENRKDLSTSTGLPQFSEEEKVKNSNSADFIAINYKTGKIAKNNENFRARENMTAIVDDARVRLADDWRADTDEEGVALVPFGIRRFLKFLKEEFTEKNVMISSIKASSDPLVDFNDISRISWIESHLNQIARAITESRFLFISFST